MARTTLGKLFRSMAFKPRKPNRFPNRFPLFLEDIEDRIAPAVLPQPNLQFPTADTLAPDLAALPRQDPTQANQNTSIDYVNPQVVADPANALRQVMVATSVTTSPANGTILGVVAAYTTNGGSSWIGIGIGTKPRDPQLPANTQPNANYRDATSPSVAFGRNGQIYFTYLVHNADKSSGAVMFQRTNTLTGGVVDTDTVYQWTGGAANGQPALNPVIAVDNNLATDPQTGDVDTMVSAGGLSKGVYIAWNGNATTRAQDLALPSSYNANPILAVVSTNNGLTWSNPTPVSDDGYFSSSDVITGGDLRSAAPKIVFSPTASGRPGSLIFVWPQFDGTIRYDSTAPDGGVATNTAGEVVVVNGSTQSEEDVVPLGEGEVRGPYNSLISGNANPGYPQTPWNYGNSGIADAAQRVQGTAIAFNGVASIVGDQVDDVIIDYPGYGYDNPVYLLPIALGGGVPITFGGGGGSGAAGRGLVGLDGRIFDVVITARGSGYTSAPTAVFAAPQDLTGGATDVANTTVFRATVNGVGTDPNFSLADLSVTVGIIDPTLADMRIVLVAPNGRSVQLLDSRIDGNGAARPVYTALSPMVGMNHGVPNGPAFVQGIDAGLGVTNNFYGDTIFNSDAARRINDANNTFPYIGVYRPEDGNITSTNSIAEQLNYDGAGNAGMDGDWFLVITDFRNDRTPAHPIQSISHWSLKFTSGITAGFGTDGDPGRAGIPINADPTASSQTLSPAMSPIATGGIPGAISVAFDTTGGNFTQFGGSLYIAYTTPIINSAGAIIETNIRVDRATILGNGALSFQTTDTQTNDDAAIDHFTQGNRWQYLPSVTVDTRTGTVVATWYDARLDANNTRASTFVATSIDGAASWSDQTYNTTASAQDVDSFGTVPFLNQPKNARDIITGTTYTLQPVPTNIALTSTFDSARGPGIRQSVIAEGGRIYSYWAGNANAVGSGIFQARAVTAGGPRVVSSSMGPVLTASTAGAFTYNATVDATGVRGLDGFTVTFDRPVDPTTVTPAAFEIFYHNPYDPIGTNVPITPLTVDMVSGNTVFLVRFAPQYRPGTYSYAVRPVVRDRLNSGGGVVPSGPPVTYQNDTNQVIADPGLSTSTVTVTALPGQVVANVTVEVNIAMTWDGDLQLYLRSPSGTLVPLALDRGGSGDNFGTFDGGFNPILYTVFSDAAGTAIGAGTAPFAGTFRPESPLAALIGEDPIAGTGVWTLEIIDTLAPDTATLNSWRLNLTLGTLVTGASNGNLMDQDADATLGEFNTDSWAIPNPVFGVPFSAPYVSTTLPLIIPGPYLIGSAVPNGGSVDTDMVLEGVATSVIVTFSYDINDVAANGPVFGPGNIVRITGPGGTIYDRATATSNPLTVTRIDARNYRIGFPAQVLSGHYTVEIDPLFAAATNPNTTLGVGRNTLIDTNMNAALDVIRGAASPTVGTPVNSTYNGSFSGAAQVIPAATGVFPGRAEFPITINDSFPITLSAGHQIRLQLNVSSTVPNSNRVVDLVAELIAPNGKVIRLFTNVGQVNRTPGLLWFSNTLLDDTAQTPIQTGFQPFDSGPYNPQFPLSELQGLPSNGIWTLRILNHGTETPNLTSWSISLPRINGGTGLGEVNADRISVSFRVFNQNPADRLTQDVWTAVGPASENGTGNSSRTNALAVDPSDPSGNTVYLGAASSGLWKTTNFLTLDSRGPTWLPLGDSAPAFGLNVVSIAVFPRNNDPQQSIIFALTGEGDTLSPGVGVLRSMDGGRTWTVLDSSNNSTSTINGQGSISPIASNTRDRAFFGMSGYKIIVDPTAVNNADKDVVVYLAGTRGVWRSTDTGRHWTRITTPGTGVASDIVLAEGSAAKVGTPHLQILYVGVYGTGVFMAQPATVAASMVQLTGATTGNGSFVDSDTPPGDMPTIPIAAPSETPNGAKGRIMLATPALSASALENLNYQGWLYALVADPADFVDGLYVTKDFGNNWTKISTAEYRPSATAAFGTNDYTQRDYDPIPTQANYNIGFAIDPNNPNVVYYGGSNNPPAVGPIRGFLRVDTTGLQDAGAIVAYDNSSTPPGNAVQFTADAGNVTIKAPNPNVFPDPVGVGQPYGVVGSDHVTTGLLNVLRDPTAPFTSGSQIEFSNVVQINNKGWGARIKGIAAEVQTDVHRIITFRDQATGKTRLIVGDDQGVASVVDDGQGNIISSIGSLQLPNKIRNGNLQTVQFYSSTTHPGQLAIEIADAMFYGMAQDNGFPISNADILQTGIGTAAGLLSWDGIAGDGSWILADQTGSGTTYQYRWPCCANDGLPGREMFRVTPPGTGPSGIGRTFNMILPTDNPENDQGQWGTATGAEPRFAVNPIDPNGMMISSPGAGTASNRGQLWRTTDQGRTWFRIASPNVTGLTNIGGYAHALAFGSPATENPNEFNNFLYAGVGSTVWVTFTGGSPWTNISAGISGAVQQIVPDPTRGSRAVYAVTSSGVFFKADAATAAPWQNITGNIFTESKFIFEEENPSPQNGVPAMLRRLTSLAVDWRYAIPIDPNDPNSFTFPVLYAGGYGGVVRSVDFGQTWKTYPEGRDYTYLDPNTGNNATIQTPDGGYFPSVDITQLTLSQGNIDPNTGAPIQQTGGLNMLTAATYGRGTWVIRLGTPDNDPEIDAITRAGYQTIKQSGPRVIAVDVQAQPNTIRVQFDAPLLAKSFTTGDVRIRDANGNFFTINSVTALVDTIGPFAPYKQTLPVGTFVDDYHDYFQLSVTPPPGYTPFPGGFAEIVIGPNINDYAGFGMNQDDDFFNGETPLSASNGGWEEDAYHGYVVIGAATAGNLHIDQPITTTAGEPTRVIVSALNTQGRPLTSFTGTVRLATTVNGRQAVLTDLPVVQIKDLTADGVGNVTVRTLAPVPFIVGQVISIGGVGTAVYNSGPNGFTVTSVSPDMMTFTYTDAMAAGAPPDRTGGGNVTGPFVPVASTTPATTPYTLAIPTFPTTYTYTAADAGTKVFTIYYLTATDPAAIGTTTQTLLSVTDLSGTVNAAQDYITVVANNATQFRVEGVSPVIAGDTHTWTVSAIDAFGNIDTSYTGEVELTSGDTQASFVQSPYIFVPGDAGVHTFSVTLRTAGLQTVTVTDDANAPILITGGQTVRVMPATPTTINVFGFPSPTVAGVAHDYTVQLFDAFGNLATNYAGTVTMTNNDPYTAILPHFNPSMYTFTAEDEYTPAIEDAGSKTFTNGATLYTAGNRTITVSDLGLGIAGSQTGINVVAAAMSQFVVSGFPTPTAAGSAKNFTVRAADPYGNRVSSYTGKAVFSTSDTQGTFASPINASSQYTFTAGDAGQRTFSATLRTAGSQSITVQDFNSPLTLNGTQSGIVITPLAASTVQVTELTTPRMAGTDGDFRVTFRDIYNNIATGFTGNVVFSTTDPLGTFSPSSYTFTAGDMGQKLFTNGANLRMVGTWNIRATAGALTGTQNNIEVTPAPATVAIVTGHTTPVVAGTPSDFTVELRDPYGNRDTNFTGNVVFSSNDPQATFLPPNYTYTTGIGGDNGIHTFIGGSTLKTTGTSRSITATSGLITGTQSPIVVTPNVATYFDVDQFPGSTTAGDAHNFRVTARDAYGNIATGYTGSVTFTSDDLQAVFAPTGHTFTAADMGVYFATGTLKTAGTRRITVTDTVTASITGAQTNILVTPAATSQFIMNFPTPVTAGTQHGFSVRAADPYGNTTPGYTGTVTLTSSDTQAVFDPSATVVFGVSDNGEVSLQGELRTAGAQSITATDGTFTGTQNGIIVNPDVADYVDITGFPLTTTAGVGHSFTVTVRDQFGNTATGYTGTLTFFSGDDGQATFAPPTHTFTASDAGVTTVVGTLKTAGMRSISATDGVSISGTQSGITVVAAAAARVDLFGFPSSTVAGIAHDFTVTLYDPFNNVATGFLGTMTFTSDDAQASLPTPYAFTAGDQGTHTFTGGATLRTAGTRFIRGTSGSLVGEQSPITVTPAATSKFVVENFLSPITAGVSDVFTVRATDAFNNTTPTYTGAATLTSSDGQASFSPNNLLVFGASDNGVRTTTGTLRTAGFQSITATQGLFTGSQTNIQVTPAAASQVIVNGFPTTIMAGTPGSFTVTLLDPFNNVATGYTGTLTFSSSDPQRSFSPASHPFTLSDAGTRTFTNGATLRTAGLQSITASDGSISGSQSNILVTPAATSQFITNFPSPVTAGVLQSFTLRAADAFGNTTPTYTGTATLSSTSAATFSSNPVVFASGDNGVRNLTGTLFTSGTRSITATDGTFSGTQNGIIVNAAAPAAVVVSGVPSPTTAGVARTFTVSVRDAFNNVATSYLGTMTFTSSDGQATFAPGSHVFTGADQGQRTFSSGVTLKTAGSQTVVATDSANSLSGFQTVTVTPAAASTVIVTTSSSAITAGDPVTFTATLRDPFNNVATGYLGTVFFSSTDGQATFSPTSHTFTAGDQGTQTFTNGATLRTAGSQTITVGDGSISGTSPAILVSPAATSKFITNFPSPVTAGTSHGFTVRAADAFNNTTPTYTGTATISVDDIQAGFSSTTVAFTVSDNGVRPVTGTLRTAGSRTISVTDGTFTGTQANILVNAAAASRLDVTGFPSPTVAGVPHDFTVTAFDAFNNVATGYTGTIGFSSNDSKATFSVSSFTFTGGDAGTHTFVNGATLKTVGSRTITVSDGTLNGVQSNIQVNPAAAASLQITGFPNTVVATADQGFTVTARDAFNNVASGYTGTVAFTSSDSFGTFVPGPYTFTTGDAGSHAFVGNFSTPGLQTFTVQDTGNGSLIDTETNIAVTPGPVASFTLDGAPATAEGGTAFTLTVRALDRFGRPLTTYNGSVVFSSSDPYANLPTGVTLVNGVATVSVTLHTPAVRTITVRDSVNAAAAGSTSVNVDGGPMQPALVTSRFAVGTGRGAGLNLYEANGSLIRSYEPFGPGFTGGIRTVVADFNLDGVPDVAAGSGPGITAQVKVFDGVTNNVLFDIQPFADFTGGVFVSSGSLLRDGFPDLIVTPDRGGGPRVSIFHGGSFNKIADYFGIADENFRGGARASAGDFNGDGLDDVIVSAGFLGGPRISIWDGAALLQGRYINVVGDFFAFDQGLRDGAYVAAGDVNGDGIADAIFGAGPGGGPRTTVVDGTELLANPQAAINSALATFFTGDFTKRGGIREAIKDIDGDEFADLIVGDGEDVGSSVRIYLGVNLKDGSIGREFSFRAFPEVNAGVYVG